MPDSERLQETRAFFGPRAATWDERFPNDSPKFAAALQHLQLQHGSVAVDVGCGTGRALPHLQRSVGPGGFVIGLDVAPGMCVRARECGWVILGDAGRLPLPTAACDAVFAAGLLNHLPDPPLGLAEFARVTRPGARLALFHPIGRSALA